MSLPMQVGQSCLQVTQSIQKAIFDLRTLATLHPQYADHLQVLIAKFKSMEDQVFTEILSAFCSTFSQFVKTTEPKGDLTPAAIAETVEGALRTFTSNVSRMDPEERRRSLETLQAMDEPSRLGELLASLTGSGDLVGLQQLFGKLNLDRSNTNINNLPPD